MKRTFLDDITARIWKSRFQGSVADWCRQHLWFDEAGNHSPFSTTGAEYTSDVLNDFADIGVSDEVLVWGSQTRKTGTLMGGVAWALVNDPCGFLWVMPSVELARKFSRQRWQKLVEASPATMSLVPSGARRHSWATLEQVLASSTINFVGSNSASGLASSPCRRVILDEVEKFNESPNSEADAVNLAEQRTKNQPCPQRWKTSTPAMVDGLIWQEFQKGDQRRYFVPCPHCSKHVVLAWSSTFTIFPKTGAEAFVAWDQEAKRTGTWDLDVVAASAHAVCPHCSGAIRDEHKPGMIARGEWRATTSGASGFVSRHLPSLYSTAAECNFGRLAVKFLQAKFSLTGLQGFINGDLAEPYMAQDTITTRSSALTESLQVGAEWQKIMTVDCQGRAPHFWAVTRAWDKDSGSEAISAQSADTWEDVVAIQKRDGVNDRRVTVDSGFGARSESEVYATCASHCDIWTHAGSPVMIGGLVGISGWTPCKGLPGRRRWTNESTKSSVPYFIRQIDPFLGTVRAGKFGMELFEFSSDTFADVLDVLAQNKGTFRWTVGKNAQTEDYWKHWDSEVRAWVVNARTNKGAWIWRLRSSRWPNHLRDCEKMQVAFATLLGLLTIDPPKDKA
jgi:hypothetical protein